MCKADFYNMTHGEIKRCFEKHLSGLREEWDKSSKNAQYEKRVHDDIDSHAHRHCDEINYAIKEIEKLLAELHLVDDKSAYKENL